MIGMAAPLSISQSPLDPGSARTFADAVRVYIYGYPLVTMGLTERVSTTVPGVAASRAPINQLAKLTTLPNGSYKDVVLPSTSTMYISGFVDLTAQPMILHIPQINRFWLMETLDAWTNVSPQSPGTRTGSPPGDYAVVGPNWTGTLPPGVNEIRMPTNTAWIIGRIFTSGTEDDLAYLNTQVVPQITLTPLSAFGASYTPPQNLGVDPSIDTVTTPVHQAANMDACAFFGTLAAMLRTNPPLLPQDEPTVKRLAKIHIVPGQPFDCSDPTLDSATKAALQLAVEAGRKTLQSTAGFSTPPTSTNWYMQTSLLGDYGRHYLLRAIVAEKAIGSNLPQDVVYAYGINDNNNEPLKRTNQYVIHFNAKTAPTFPLPPVNPSAFWSVTIYNADGTLVDNKTVDYNAIGVGPLGPTIQGHSACFNADGSLDLYLRADPPSGATQFCNWLPIPPQGSADPTQPDFIVFLRMYWPDASVLNGSWIPPVIQKVN